MIMASFDHPISKLPRAESLVVMRTQRSPFNSGQWASWLISWMVFDLSRHKFVRHSLPRPQAKVQSFNYGAVDFQRTDNLEHRRVVFLPRRRCGQHLVRPE